MSTSAVSKRINNVLFLDRRRMSNMCIRSACRSEGRQPARTAVAGTAYLQPALSSPRPTLHPHRGGPLVAKARRYARPGVLDWSLASEVCFKSGATRSTRVANKRSARPHCLLGAAKRTCCVPVESRDAQNCNEETVTLLRCYQLIF